MADSRKVCNECKHIYSRPGHFEGRVTEDCMLVIQKFTINKEVYDTIKRYWDKRLRNNEVMDFECPGFNAQGI